MNEGNIEIQDAISVQHTAQGMYGYRTGITLLRALGNSHYTTIHYTLFICKSMSLNSTYANKRIHPRKWAPKLSTKE